MCQIGAQVLWLILDQQECLYVLLGQANVKTYSLGAIRLQTISPTICISLGFSLSQINVIDLFKLSHFGFHSTSLSLIRCNVNKPKCTENKQLF